MASTARVNNVDWVTRSNRLVKCGLPLRRLCSSSLPVLPPLPFHPLFGHNPARLRFRCHFITRHRLIQNEHGHVPLNPFSVFAQTSILHRHCIVVLRDPTSVFGTSSCAWIELKFPKTF